MPIEKGGVVGRREPAGGSTTPTPRGDGAAGAGTTVEDSKADKKLGAEEGSGSEQGSRAVTPTPLLMPDRKGASIGESWTNNV